MAVQLAVDSIKIQETFHTLADLIADLGPGFDRVRNEIMGQGFVAVAVRNPVKEEHLKLLDAYLKSMANDVATAMRQPMSGADQVKHQKALKWIQLAYTDFCEAVRREMV